eukprot:Rmarinus@m.16735
MDHTGSMPLRAMNEFALLPSLSEDQAHDFSMKSDAVQEVVVCAEDPYTTIAPVPGASLPLPLADANDTRTRSKRMSMLGPSLQLSQGCSFASTLNAVNNNATTASIAASGAEDDKTRPRRPTAVVKSVSEGALDTKRTQRKVRRETGVLARNSDVVAPRVDVAEEIESPRARRRLRRMPSVGFSAMGPNPSEVDEAVQVELVHFSTRAVLHDSVKSHKDGSAAEGPERIRRRELTEAERAERDKAAMAAYLSARQSIKQHQKEKRVAASSSNHSPLYKLDGGAGRGRVVGEPMSGGVVGLGVGKGSDAKGDDKATESTSGAQNHNHTEQSKCGNSGGQTDGEDSRVSGVQESRKCADSGTEGHSTGASGRDRGRRTRGLGQSKKLKREAARKRRRVVREEKRKKRKKRHRRRNKRKVVAEDHPKDIHSSEDVIVDPTESDKGAQEAEGEEGGGSGGRCTVLSKSGPCSPVGAEEGAGETESQQGKGDSRPKANAKHFVFGIDEADTIDWAAQHAADRGSEDEPVSAGPTGVSPAMSVTCSIDANVTVHGNGVETVGPGAGSAQATISDSDEGVLGENEPIHLARKVPYAVRRGYRRRVPKGFLGTGEMNAPPAAGMYTAGNEFDGTFHLQRPQESGGPEGGCPARSPSHKESPDPNPDMDSSPREEALQPQLLPALKPTFPIFTAKQIGSARTDQETNNSPRAPMDDEVKTTDVMCGDDAKQQGGEPCPGEGASNEEAALGVGVGALRGQTIPKYLKKDLLEMRLKYYESNESTSVLSGSILSTLSPSTTSGSSVTDGDSDSSVEANIGTLSDLDTSGIEGDDEAIAASKRRKKEKRRKERRLNRKRTRRKVLTTSTTKEIRTAGGGATSEALDDRFEETAVSSTGKGSGRETDLGRTASTTLLKPSATPDGAHEEVGGSDSTAHQGESCNSVTTVAPESDLEKTNSVRRADQPPLYKSQDDLCLSAAGEGVGEVIENASDRAPSCGSSLFYNAHVDTEVEDYRREDKHISKHSDGGLTLHLENVVGSGNEMLLVETVRTSFSDDNGLPTPRSGVSPLDVLSADGATSEPCTTKGFGDEIEVHGRSAASEASGAMCSADRSEEIGTVIEASPVQASGIRSKTPSASQASLKDAYPIQMISPSQNGRPQPPAGQATQGSAQCSPRPCRLSFPGTTGSASGIDGNMDDQGPLGSWSPCPPDPSPLPHSSPHAPCRKDLANTARSVDDVVAAVRIGSAESNTSQPPKGHDELDAPVSTTFVPPEIVDDSFLHPKPMTPPPARFAQHRSLFAPMFAPAPLAAVSAQKGSPRGDRIKPQGGQTSPYPSAMGQSKTGGDLGARSALPPVVLPALPTPPVRADGLLSPTLPSLHAGRPSSKELELISPRPPGDDLPLLTQQAAELNLCKHTFTREEVLEWKVVHAKQFNFLRECFEARLRQLQREIERIKRLEAARFGPYNPVDTVYNLPRGRKKTPPPKQEFASAAPSVFSLAGTVGPPGQPQNMSGIGIAGGHVGANRRGSVSLMRR